MGGAAKQDEIGFCTFFRKMDKVRINRARSLARVAFMSEMCRQKQPHVVRFFERQQGQFFTVHGDDATIVAQVRAAPF